MRPKQYIPLIALVVTSVTLSCTKIDDGECKINYVNYQYRNNIGRDATDQIYKMTDFIFTKDSVLARVDKDIVNGKIRRRPLTLPDGEWIVVTYGNLNGGSKVDYTIGQTRLSEISTRVINAPSYKGTYATRSDAPMLRLGDSDKLYFGKVDLVVRGGYTDRRHTVEMSNVHIWLSAVVKWADAAQAPTKAGSNLHIRLEYVPVEHRFTHDSRVDNRYGIEYRTPQITAQSASHISQLRSLTNAPDGEFYFNTYGLRWQTNRAPILRFYDGEKMLLEKDLDLNQYFSDQRIDLTNTRVQFYQLQITVGREQVSISTLAIEDWQDGGSI